MACAGLLACAALELMVMQDELGWGQGWAEAAYLFGFARVSIKSSAAGELSSCEVRSLMLRLVSCVLSTCHALGERVSQSWQVFL